MNTPASSSLIGRIDHLGLTVPDIDAAIEFYSTAIGGQLAFRLGPFDSRELSQGDEDWTAAHVRVPDALYDVAMMSFAGGPSIEFLQYKRPQGRTEPPRNNDAGGVHIAFEVSDLDAAIERVVQHGGVAQAGPIVVPAGSDENGSWAAFSVNYITDPWGNQLELVFYPDGR
jgi:glyoxylase I family protein